MHMDECYAVSWMMLLAHKAYGWKKLNVFMPKSKPNYLIYFHDPHAWMNQGK